jgi:hypothetical protein
MAVVASDAESRFTLVDVGCRWTLIVTSSCGAAFGDLLYRGIVEISNWKQFTLALSLVLLAVVTVIDPVFEGVRATLIGLPSEISSAERRAGRLRRVGFGLIATASLILHEMVHAALSKETEEHQLASILILLAASLTVGIITWCWIGGARHRPSRAASYGALGGVITEGFADLTIYMVAAVPVRQALWAIVGDAIRFGCIGWVGGLIINKAPGPRVACKVALGIFTTMACFLALGVWLVGQVNRDAVLSSLSFAALWGLALAFCPHADTTFTPRAVSTEDEPG